MLTLHEVFISSLELEKIKAEVILSSAGDNHYTIFIFSCVYEREV